MFDNVFDSLATYNLQKAMIDEDVYHFKNIMVMKTSKSADTTLH